MKTESSPDKPLKSSLIKSVSHDGRNLTVRFTNDRLYRFNEVPGKLVERLQKADSAGQFFNTHPRQIQARGGKMTFEEYWTVNGIGNAHERTIAKDAPTGEN